MYKALLFDLDNTLLDFDNSEKVGLLALYQTYFQHMQEDEFHEHYHRINKQLWQQVEEGKLLPGHVRQQRFISLAETHEALSPVEMSRFYEKHLAEHAHYLPGAEAAIKVFAQHFKLAIITNGFTDIQQSKIERSGLEKYCECIIVSETVGIAKPDPRIFNLALEKLTIKAEEALMIGDSLSSDYQGAINAGLDFCWVNPNKQDLPIAYHAPAFEVQSVIELLDRLVLAHS